MIHEIALTIKPTMRCNMHCKHCFNGDYLNNGGLVDINEVYRFLEVAAKQYKDVKVTFHGGEPTLAGYDFYDSVFSYQHRLTEKYGSIFSNLFTTNGLLLDDKLSDLLIGNNTLINISFDGPFNSILREQTEKVYNTICMLQQKNARMRIFCTVCNPTYINLVDTYKWFRDKKLNFKILPIEPRGFANENKDFLMNPVEFVDKLSETYRMWLKDTSSEIRVYTFEEFSRLRCNTQFKEYWFNREIALNPDGRIYPFGRPNDIHYCLGTPSKIDSLDECFSSDEYLRLRSDIEEYWSEFCGSCESKHICRGVLMCMSYVYGNEKNSLIASCNMSTHIFKAILEINDQVINDFKNGNGYLYNSYVQKQFA